MKLTKLTSSDYLTIVAIIIGVIIGLYAVETKKIIERIMGRWQILLLIVSVCGLVFKILQIYCRFKIEEKFDTVDKYNKQLISAVEEDRRTNQMTMRIFRDAWLSPSINKDENSKEAYARLFYDMGITIPELEKYFNREFLDIKDLTDRVKRIHHDEESKKLKK